MIVPVTHEDEWMKVLDSLPDWNGPSGDVLILVPHPDDEVLGAGGLVATLCKRDHRITVVAVTDGEAAYGKDDRLGSIREAEQACALDKLGIAASQIVRLRLPDSDVEGRESQLVAQILPVITAATFLLAPWDGDFHPDHEACGRAAREIASRTGVQVGFYFFWTWHRGTPELLSKLSLRKFRLDPEAVAQRDEALRCHASQLHRSNGEPVLPESLLGPMKRPFEVFLIP